MRLLRQRAYAQPGGVRCGVSRRAQRRRFRFWRRDRRSLGRPVARRSFARQSRRHGPDAAIAPRRVRLRASLFPPRRQAVGHQRAAAAAAAAFPGWTQAGFQHGFFHDPQSTDEVIRRINRRGRTCSWSAWAIRSRSNGFTAIASGWRSRCVWAWAGCSTIGPAISAAHDVASPGRGRMAGDSLPAAAQGPPLSARKSALPLAGDSFASDGVMRVLLSPHKGGRRAKPHTLQDACGFAPPALPSGGENPILSPS